MNTLKPCKICKTLSIPVGFHGEPQVYCYICKAKAGAQRKRIAKIKRARIPKPNKFYSSREWRELRFKALAIHGRRCLSCGAAPPDVVLHVDHIKPISRFPELALSLSNLQVLCKECNLGKSNKSYIDLRTKKD